MFKKLMFIFTLIISTVFSYSICFAVEEINSIKNAININEARKFKEIQIGRTKYLFKQYNPTINCFGKEEIKNIPASYDQSPLLFDLALNKIGYPADYKGIRSAISQFNKTYFFVQVADDPLTRGIWLDKSTEIWSPSFYLFSHNVNENYLAWTRRFGIQFKEITTGENSKKLLERELKNEEFSVYSIPINNMEWSIYLLASIDEKIDNLEIVDITNENNNTLNVIVKSNLTGTEFSIVPDMQGTIKQLNIHNKKYQTHLKIPPPSIISWQFSKDSIKAAKKIIEDGFHFWATNDYKTNLIAKLIEIKNDEVIIETLHGKKVTIKINMLIQRDQDYIKERKKN